MILNSSDSMEQLKKYFNDTLDDGILNLTDVIHLDSNTTNPELWNSLIIDNSNITSIDLSHLAQSPFRLAGNNLTKIKLDSLTQIEFGQAYNQTSPIYTLPSGAEGIAPGFLQNTKLRKLELPNFRGTGCPYPSTGVSISDETAKYASFRNNYWLREVSMGNSKTEVSSSIIFNGAWFRNNYSLLALKLNYPYVINIARTEGFNTTPIIAGDGHIYVPSDLVDSYKAHSVWGTLRNRILPLENCETEITKYEDSLSSYSWNQIINGSYDFDIGATKTAEINGIPVQMVIVAKGNDADTLVEGGHASYTWLSKNIFLFDRVSLSASFTTIDNHRYANAVNYRAIFSEIYSNIDDPYLKAGIKQVTKTAKGYNGNVIANVQSQDYIWPPSIGELGYDGTVTPYPYYSGNNQALYTFGLSTLMQDENNQVIAVALRDFNSSGSYPDTLVADPNNNRMIINQGSVAIGYIIFGFCT